MRVSKPRALIVFSLMVFILVVIGARMFIGGLWNPEVRYVLKADAEDMLDFSKDSYMLPHAENALFQLFKNQSPTADEALVIVSSCYHGSHNDEEIAEEIVARGPRMLPLLRKYRNRRFFSPCLDSVDGDTDAMMEAIRKGEHWK